MTIRTLLQDKAQKYQSKPAVIFNEQEISFGELHDHVMRFANALLDLGVGKSDKVGIFLPNCLEYVYGYLACFSIGAVVVPLDFMLKNEELGSCLGHAQAKVLIAQAKNALSFDQIRAEVPSLEKIVLVGQDPVDQQDMCSYQSIIAKASTTVPDVTIEDHDPALIMYTSGTIGKPKGILLNYLHLEGSPKAMEYFVDLSDRDVKLCAIPFSHIAGLIYIQNCVLFGITLIVMGRFNPFEFLKNIQRYRVTCFHIVPAMYTAILSLKQIENFDLSSLRWMVVFGAPSSPEILERFHKYCPNAQLLNGWGMTETCPPNTVTPLGSQNIASVGKPSEHCQIRLVDEQGQEVPVGEIGELTISSRFILDSYYKDPDLTAQTIRNGWLYTGDLARFDADGFLYIVGRKKEMIKVGGQIVFAPEVEAAFYKNEHVAEAAVIGVKDDLRGEVAKAFIVLREGSQVSQEDLRYFAREHLAHFKVPHAIELRSQLPKNRTGKIDKSLLEQEQNV